QAGGGGSETGKERVRLSLTGTRGLEGGGDAGGESPGQRDRINLGFDQHLPGRDVDLLEQFLDLLPFLRRPLDQDRVIELVRYDAWHSWRLHLSGGEINSGLIGSGRRRGACLRGAKRRLAVALSLLAVIG